ncbi:MAG: response regulator transcription factor [Pelistega sp.]|nr:response regulator transcription factor [Pelistega sp.]
MKKNSTLLLSKNLAKISNLVSILKYSFPELYIAYDESTVYETISKDKPDLIVIDAMSIKNTSICVRLIKNHTSLMDCPIVIITEDDNSDEGVASLREGAADYFSISVCDEEFYLRISTHLNDRLTVTADEEELVETFSTVFPIEDRDILIRSERYLSNFMEEVRNVSDLCLAIGISERKINDIFKFHLGVSTAEYIRNKKILKSKELLKTTRMSMCEIAVEVGYSSAANFSTAFKQSIGLTPSTYRSKNRMYKYNQ